MKPRSLRKTLRNSIASLLTGATILTNLSRPLLGAGITFGSPQNIGVESDVLNAGTTAFAYDWGNGNRKLNTVDFVSLQNATPIPLGIVGLGTIRINAFGSSASPFAIMSAGYQSLAGSGISGGPTATVTLNALSIGHVYATQVWVNDASGPTGRSLTVASAGGNSKELRYSWMNTAGSPGQYIIGGFVADAASESFTLTGTRRRETTRPPSSTLSNSATLPASGAAR
jgi:hypothetical protein